MDSKHPIAICPVEYAGGLDNSLRHFVQNPLRILKPYLRKGMKVLDVGCGPGFFSIAMARLVGDSGKVTAADLQVGMLNKLREKIKDRSIEKTIHLHKCRSESMGIEEKFDFILAFYMVHEVPDPDIFLREIKSLLKVEGRILIVEPRFHVSKRRFREMVDSLEQMGLKMLSQPRIFFSRAVLLGTNL